MITEKTNFTIHDFRIQTKTSTHYNMSSHHFHDVYEIYYLSEGIRDYFIVDSTYRVKIGDLVLIKPHDLHKTVDTGVSHSRVLISFRLNFIPFYDRDTIIESCFRRSRVLSLDLKDKLILEEYIRNMVLISDKDNPYHISQLQIQLFELLITISKHLEAHEDESYSVINNDKVYEIVHYLKKHYNKKIHLQDLANEFYISRYYMTRLFKKNTGFTIIEYLSSLRVVEAQKLLTKTQLNIIEIAQLIGFSNVSSFGKVFKSITGVTPSQYRKTHK